MNKLLPLLGLLLTLHGSIIAQAPKYEMRAAWLTTVYGLDWPQAKIPASSQAYYISLQKNQLIKILDNLKAANLNTVFFQIRSECDAMYNSSYEPWSSYLVETRGADPGYDPLTFVIEEAHKRGMELHAWLNPYRFETQVGKYAGQAGDYRLTNPDWVLEYPDKANGSKNVSILDPGRPGVRQRIVDIVKEVVSNYDVDGITFDDYFYAYGGTPDNLDLATQNLYKPAAMDLHDWRRSNVNQMVADVYQMIQNNKPWVTFGLSTFGIWTTDKNVAEKEGLTLPQGITGLDAYKSIYCDPVAWLREGTVDYVSPQLYWPTTSTGQDYDVLSPWWSDVCSKFHKHLYVSHSLSDLEPSTYAALKSGTSEDWALELNGMSLLEFFAMQSNVQLKLAPTEYGKQIQVNRDADKMGAPGSVFFRTANLYIEGFVNYLRSHEYKHQSLAPAINWKPTAIPALPSDIQLVGEQLQWSPAESNVRYAVYAIPNTSLSQTETLTKADNLLGLSYTTGFDITAFSALKDTHTFAVAVVDRYGNEYPAVLMRQAPGNNLPVNLVQPANGKSVFQPFTFEWEGIPDAESYFIEIAEDLGFSKIIYKREVLNTQFDASAISLSVGNAYYWRVRSRVTGADDEVSEVRSFTLIEQPRCEITSPVNNASNVALTPDIVWTNFGDGYTYTVEISLNSSFESLAYQKADIAALTHKVPTNTLLPFATYHLRVKATQGVSESAWSDPVVFSTVAEAPDVPVIISPSEGQGVGTADVEITIKEEPRASSFRVELCERPDFHYLYIKVKTLDAFNYVALYEDLSESQYYVRVKANFANNLSTAWSPVRSFTRVATSINDQEQNDMKISCKTQLADTEELITVNLPKPCNARLVLYNLLGKEVMVLANGHKSAGEHVVRLATGALQNGMYILSLKTEYGHKTLKVIK